MLGQKVNLFFVVHLMEATDLDTVIRQLLKGLLYVGYRVSLLATANLAEPAGWSRV